MARFPSTEIANPRTWLPLGNCSQIPEHRSSGSFQTLPTLVSSQTLDPIVDRSQPRQRGDFSRQSHFQGQMKPKCQDPFLCWGPWESWKMLGVTEDPGWGEKSAWNQQACLLNCLNTLQGETWIPRAPVPCVISFLTINQHLLSHLNTWYASPSSLRESLGGLSFRPPKP